MYAIGDGTPRGEVRFNRPDHAIDIYFAGRRRVDVEYWRRADALAIAARLAAIRVGHEFVADALSETEQTFVHRVLIGVPLAEPEAFAAFRAAFSADAFRAFLTQHATHRIDGAIEDVIGMIDDDDRASVVTRARDLAGFAIDVHRYRLGSTNPLPKWRGRIHLAQTPTRFSAELWRLYFPDGPALIASASLCAAYGRACVELANEVVEWVQG